MPQLRSLPYKAQAFLPKHQLSLFCLVGPATSPSGSESQPLKHAELQLAGEGEACVHCAMFLAHWGLGKSLQQRAGGDMEQSPQNICLSLTAEPCSADKASVQSCAGLQLWLCESGRSPALLLQPSRGALGQGLSSGLEREMGAWGVTWCCVLGSRPLVCRADHSYSVPLRSSTRRQLCCSAGWTPMQDTSGFGCLPLPFTAEQREALGAGAPLALCPSGPAGSRAPGSPSCCAPHVRQGQPAPEEPCPQLFYIPSALVSVTVQITCDNKPHLQSHRALSSFHFSNTRVCV